MTAVTQSLCPTRLSLFTICKIRGFTASTDSFTSIICWKGWEKASCNGLSSRFCCIKAALDTKRRDKAEATVTAAAAGTLAVAFMVGVVVAGGVRHFC
jgi:hypothetical protein